MEVAFDFFRRRFRLEPAVLLVFWGFAPQNSLTRSPNDALANTARTGQWFFIYIKKGEEDLNPSMLI